MRVEDLAGYLYVQIVDGGVPTYALTVKNTFALLQNPKVDHVWLLLEEFSPAGKALPVNFERDVKASGAGLAAQLQSMDDELSASRTSAEKEQDLMSKTKEVAGALSRVPVPGKGAKGDSA